MSYRMCVLLWRCKQITTVIFLVLDFPEPIAFYPLNARYEATEKENRQLRGIVGDVAITNGPYNEPGEAYMFYGTESSYIVFPNNGGLDIRFSITMTCWVQPEGQDGPLVVYENFFMWIMNGKFTSLFVKPWALIQTAEVLPAGEWVHVAASYDHNSGNNSLYINGHLTASKNIGTGYKVATASQTVRMETRGDLYFKGKIAELKIHDVVLNEAQIQTSIIQGN